MLFFATVLLMLVVIACFACLLSVWGWDQIWGMIVLFVGLASILLLVFSPIWNPSGLPLSDIDPGTYKVGFVYVAGDSVNIAVEWKRSEIAAEEICHYQFKKDAFEGVVNTNGKKLVVVQSGSFKKLRLE